MNLKALPDLYAIARLAADAPIPDWLDGPGLSALVRADDELTIVCRQDRIPSDVTSDRDWAAFRSLGPFAFDETGIVAALITPLSSAGIGVFVLCTFDGEHILCPAKHFAQAQVLLTTKGHHFV